MLFERRQVRKYAKEIYLSSILLHRDMAAIKMFHSLISIFRMDYMDLFPYDISTIVEANDIGEVLLDAFTPTHEIFWSARISIMHGAAQTAR